MSQAAAHDYTAIISGYSMILAYEKSHGKWYKLERNKPNDCSEVKYDGVTLNCDEYPFNASNKGGEDQNPQPSLRVIDATQNWQEGNMYWSFVRKCKLNTPPVRSFLVVPVVTDPEATVGPQTTSWCGRKVGGS